MRRKNPESERESAVELLTLLLNGRKRLLQTGSLTGSHDGHFRKLCSELLWRHSEAWGKYAGCPLWSQLALESRERHGKPVTSKAKCGNDALRHEHLFPRKQTIQKLFALDCPDGPTIADLLSRLNIAIVVTCGDHDKLPKSGTEPDPWERYRQAGVEVVDCAGKRPPTPLKMVRQGVSVSERKSKETIPNDNSVHSCRARRSDKSNRATKEDRRKWLQDVAVSLGVRDFLEQVRHFIESRVPAYCWPGKTAYCFYLNDRAADGKRRLLNYVTLYLNSNEHGSLLLSFSHRAADMAREDVDEFCAQVGSAITQTNSDAAFQVKLTPSTWPTVSSPLGTLLNAIVSSRQGN